MFSAVRTCGLPQIEPDLMYNMTVNISHDYNHHHSHYNNHHNHNHHDDDDSQNMDQVKPGERVVFNCKVDLSCMVSTIRW